MKYYWCERGGYISKKARQYLHNDFSPEKVKNITVIRQAALGDLVIVRPFLTEARRFFPNAKITLVGVSNYQYGMPSDLVDETIFVSGREKKAEMTVKKKYQEFSQLPHG